MKLKSNLFNKVTMKLLLDWFIAGKCWPKHIQFFTYSVLVRNYLILSMKNKEEGLLIIVMKVGFYGINVWNPDIFLELTHSLEPEYVCTMAKQDKMMLWGQDSQHVSNTFITTSWCADACLIDIFQVSVFPVFKIGRSQEQTWWNRTKQINLLAN